MKKFISGLFSSSDGVSSKRFISLYSLILLTIFIVCDFCGIHTSEYIFWGLIGLITGSSTMTLLKRQK